MTTHGRTGATTSQNHSSFQAHASRDSIVADMTLTPDGEWKIILGCTKRKWCTHRKSLANPSVCLIELHFTLDGTKQCHCVTKNSLARSKKSGKASTTGPSNQRSPHPGVPSPPAVTRLTNNIGKPIRQRMLRMREAPDTVDFFYATLSKASDPNEKE